MVYPSSLHARTHPIDYQIACMRFTLTTKLFWFDKAPTRLEFLHNQRGSRDMLLVAKDADVNSVKKRLKEAEEKKILKEQNKQKQIEANEKYKKELFKRGNKSIVALLISFDNKCDHTS